MAFIRSRGFKVLLALAGLLVLAGVGGAIAFYLAFVRDLPDLHGIADYEPALASRVYARDGRPIAEFFSERRRLTPFEDIPEHVVEAFVAGEDSAFFDHAGIDYMGILRAAWVNLRAGGATRQGGSTITQQMVKGLLLTPEQTYRRKIREMILARRIEERFSKPEILYLYLNQIYFGHGAYGIGEAARTYFGKDVSELSVSEGAMLAGLPKAPTRYSPFNNPEEAERRRRYVLERMHEDRLLDAVAHAEAMADVPVLAPDANDADFAAAAYFSEDVRRYLFDELGGDLVLRGGLVIETTLDLDLQHAAVLALQRGLVALDRRQGYRGPLRRVVAAEIPAEIERLGKENGFADGGAAISAAALRALPQLPRNPDGNALLVGVVTAVEPESKRALVAFAPGLAGEVTLSTVRWAREPEPSKAPRSIRAIETAFAVGDVALFALLPPSDEEGEDAGRDAIAGQPLRVTLFQKPIVQGALLSLDVDDDEVLAMVGGYDFDDSQFNRATQARRQPGSAFKPFIYGAAIARDYTVASIVWDRPVVYVDDESGFTWRPRNYGRSFYGPITLREALARSINNATVHLFRDVGVDFVIDYSRRLGITSPLARDLSLALGSSDVSLLELTRGYGVFPAGGRRVVPRFVRRVTDRHGEILLENVALGDDPALLAEPGNGDGDPKLAGETAATLADVAAGGNEALPEPSPDQVIPTEQAYLVTDLLRAVVRHPRGTGWRARDLKRPVAGKTGTTNDQADAWFMGFSADLMTGVWVGHDESRFLGWGETGSRAAAPIWVDFMLEAHASLPVRDFPVPEAIVFARIDPKTGLLADASSKGAVFEAFLAGTEPTETASAAETTSEAQGILRNDAF